MPYNPGSAYPRKTVYVPPVYGDTSFQRAVNAPDVTSQNGPGGGPVRVHGRELYGGAAAAARGASGHPDAAAGFEAMSRQGFVGSLQNQFNEQKGLRQNAERRSATRPDAPATPADLPRGSYNPEEIRHTPTSGNAASSVKRSAATELADTMADGVLTGDFKGFTGTVNTPKRKK